LGRFFGAPEFVFIPVFTVAIGDGMAEIIGRNFGKHKMHTIALFTKTEFTRSCEGSMCVFFATLISLVIVILTTGNEKWNHFQKWLNIIILPPLMTYTEAVSPHTWDNAILLFVGGGFILITFCIPPLFVLFQNSWCSVFGCKSDFPPFTTDEFDFISIGG
jgi:CDP-diglyceride synthetase